MPQAEDKIDPVLCMTRDELLKLSRREQRVVIAKDVLQLLKAQQILASHGGYMSSTLPWRVLEEEYDGEEENEILFRDFFQQHSEGETVRVCAIGAAFIAAVDKFNSLSCADLAFADAESEEMITYLERWFDEYELRLIEAAFEGQWCADDGVEEEDREEINEAVGFTEGIFDDPHARLTKIMENIIANKGTFAP